MRLNLGMLELWVFEFDRFLHKAVFNNQSVVLVTPKILILSQNIRTQDSKVKKTL